MIYGRRFFEKNNQRLSSYEQQVQRAQLSHKSMASLYQQFQHRYAWYFILSLIGPYLLFSLPCLYLVQQNFDIFEKLAYDVRPDLIRHLERERTLLFGLLAFAILAASAFCYWLTVKLMGIIAGPIWALERHMKQVTLGDWSSHDFQARSNDEFQSLVSTYSYLYRTLRVNTQRELEALESLQLDPTEKETYTTLKNMIVVKRKQLGMKEWPLTGGISAETSSSPSKRRAS